MGDHDTWYTVLMPEFWARLEHGPLKEQLGREWEWMFFSDTHFSLVHVAGALITCLFLVFAASRYRASIEDQTKGVVPPRRWTLAAMVNGFVEAVFNMATDIMGEDQARKFLPLLGTLALFIFCCNIQALIPGFLPATDTLKTNLGLAAMAFVIYNVVGIRAQGLAYFAHFLGPSFSFSANGPKAPWLFWLMLPVELASHIGRPISLSLRLMGNMVADHKVVGIMLTLVPLFVPVPFLLLGVLVCIVQTVVFTMLTMIYIAMAAEHAEGH
ncbi:MAG: F0F1 ATP synthase subunit A [Myxococcales bacterium FL481]|nr:MAG: F0F1 ATP synthase subunit A [Myxococcales bacterium FL481]